MSISDLTKTMWTFKDSGITVPSQATTYNINFTANNENFIAINTSMSMGMFVTVAFITQENTDVQVV